MDYKHRVSINSRDVDGSGVCRPSALLGHLQEAATLAAEYGGFGRGHLLGESQGFWMLVRMWYRLKRPLRWGEQIVVHTWHRGGKGAMSYRDFDIYAGEEHVGEAVSAWVLADIETHKLLKLSEIKIMQETSGGELCKDKTLSKLRLPKELTLKERRKMRYSDIDINGHVNNTRYADFACDALELERLPGEYFLSSMQLGYTAECRAGEEIGILIGEADGVHYAKGADDEGKVRFEVKITFDKTL